MGWRLGRGADVLASVILRRGLASPRPAPAWPRWEVWGLRPARGSQAGRCVSGTAQGLDLWRLESHRADGQAGRGAAAPRAGLFPVWCPWPQWCPMSSIPTRPQTPSTKLSMSHSLAPRTIRKWPLSPQAGPHELAAVQYLTVLPSGSVSSPHPVILTEWVPCRRYRSGLPRLTGVWL